VPYKRRIFDEYMSSLWTFVLSIFDVPGGGFCLVVKSRLLSGCCCFSVVFGMNDKWVQINSELIYTFAPNEIFTE
jgi:hypothetical protein